MNFLQVSENQNCATILPFDRKKKQKVYLKKKKKYVTVDAKEFMGEFIYKKTRLKGNQSIRFLFLSRSKMETRSLKEATT